MFRAALWPVGRGEPGGGGDTFSFLFTSCDVLHMPQTPHLFYTTTPDSYISCVLREHLKDVADQHVVAARWQEVRALRDFHSFHLCPS